MISVVAAGGAIGVTAGAFTGAVTLAVHSAQPIDWAGIGLLVTSVSTLIGTIGGLYMALRRSSGSISKRDADEIARALRGQLTQEGDTDAS